jgi:ubiquinone/menaquinone biosynthesis C-methylase UbiE
MTLQSALQRLLATFFRHLYTDLAQFYDLVAWLSSMGQWRQWGEVALKDLSPGRVLELGHGPGHLLAKLSESDHPFVGLDPSSRMARIAGQRLIKAGSDLKLVRGRAQDLPFSKQVFQTLISTFPSEYILAEATLIEARRVLAPGGVLIIVGLIEITGKSLPDRFSRWLYRITGQSGMLENHWLSFLEGAGFRLELEPINLPRSRVTRIVAQKSNEPDNPH